MGSAGKQAHILYAEGHVAPTAVDHRVGVDRLAALQLLVGPEPDLLAGALHGVVLQPACKDASVLRPSRAPTKALPVMLDGIDLRAAGRRASAASHGATRRAMDCRRAGERAAAALRQKIRGGEFERVLSLWPRQT